MNQYIYIYICTHTRIKHVEPKTLGLETQPVGNGARATANCGQFQFRSFLPYYNQ